jgi:FixJ family two-component response regulator
MHSLLTVVIDMFQKRKALKPTIVALLDERDGAVVRELSNSRHWEASFAATCPDVLALIGQTKAQILFMDRDLGGSDWRETMSAFVSPSNKICIMLVSRVVDTYLWNEVVRNGGYDVLPKPLRADDVSRAVSLAFSYWNSSAGSSPTGKAAAKR